MSRPSKKLALLVGLGMVPCWSLFAQDPPPASVAAQDPAKKAPSASAESRVIDKIIEEGQKKSQVMQTLDYLTNVIGPRLTASPNMKRANNWTRDKLSEWGLKDAHLEAWGPFGRGWSLKRFSMQVVEPQCYPIIAHPKPWSTGLPNGPVVGDAVLFDAKNDDDLAKYKGKLKDAIVLTAPTREVAARFNSQGVRLTDAELLALADSPDPQPRANRRSFQRRGRPAAAGADVSATLNFIRKKDQFLLDEGVAALATPARSGDGGTIFVDGIATVLRLPNASPGQSQSAYAKDAGPSIPQVALGIESYNRVVRALKQGEKIKIALDLAVQFHDDDLMSYNTVAEIPGSDLKDEIVMLGGHMDSWESGTGATDNAAGVAVCMEAVRILKALNIQPRRTIRIALWSGEEQGLYGSRAYVKEHFGGFDDGPVAYAEAFYNSFFTGDRLAPKFQPTKEYDKLSAYFNLDNGTGKVRGVYLEGNEAVRPIFRKWLEPFREMGASTITSSATGGTDHTSFDAIALPGFQFIQDPVEYNARTHHSNMDTYERIQPEDMKQASVIMAAFLYNTAMRDEKLPRKPAPTN